MSVWSAINAALTGCFDLLLWPVGRAPEWLQLAVLALPAAIVALLAFRFCSNQAGLESAKDKIRAYLLELWIYRDDLKISLLAQARFVGSNLRYLGYMSVPIAAALVPVALMWVQVEARYRWRPLDPGERVVLAVEVDGRPSELVVSLDAPEGITRETPALRIDARGEIVWRLRADAPGQYELGLRVAGREFSKRASVAANGRPPSPEVVRASDPWTLWNPLEAPLASDGPMRAVRLGYPPARGEFLEMSSAGWIWTGFILVWAFALRSRFGVTF